MCPPRPSLPALVLALCCLLAGCNTLAPGATDDGVNVPSVTPADVPAAGPDRIAPGVTDDRLANASTLLAAHQSVLANRSVRVEQRRTTRASNGSVLDEQSIEYRFAADRSRVAIDATGLQSTVPSVSLWSNESATLIRRDTGQDVHYQVRERYSGYSPIDPIAQAIGGFGGADAVPITTELLGTDAGREVYRVTLDRGEQRISLVVDERGLIRRVVQRNARATVDTGRGVDPTMRTVTTVEADVGPLERPDWVADAREVIADREYVAPGVTTDRVVDVYALVDAHRSVVANASVTYSSERWANASDGSVVRYDRTTARVAADRTNYHVVDVRRGDVPTRRSERWMNESDGYLRTTVDDTTNYERRYGGREYRIDRPQLDSRMGSSETTLTQLDDGRYRLVVDGYAAQTVGVEGPVTNPRLAVVFDERGFISRITRTYTVEARGPDRHVTQTTRYTNLGETTVERPDWLSAAINETRAGDDPTESVTTTTAVG